MDRNTILALILIGLVLLLWPVYMKRVGGTRESTREEPSVTEMKESGVPRKPESSSVVPSSESVVGGGEKLARGIGTPWQGRGEKPDTVVVETELFRGKLSSVGGGTIVSWKLKKYKKPEENKDEKEEWVELIPDSAEGNLGVVMGTDLSRTIFNVELDTLSEVKKYRFVYNFEHGGRVEKEFRIIPNSYYMEMKVRFISLSRNDIREGYTVQWRSGLSPTERKVKDDSPYYQAYALQGGEMLKTKRGSTGLREGTTDWVAIRTKYFLVAIIPQEPKGEAAELIGEKIKIRDDDGNDQDWKTFTARLVMPLSRDVEKTGEFTLYLGPMDYQHLKSGGVQLEKMMNFGWVIIRPFGIAFFYTLQFLYGIVGNYGWAIIIFSIMIKVVLYPLTRKSYQSMRQMQELQPKISALKEKYKKDPQRLNQETMKLYKQHGVNPMGGCLPMLLQMPVLFALFNLFRTTIMLRQAGFLGLIEDLSAPDAIIQGFNVLPILMGATMIIQQKLATTQNPQQKAMAYFMPIFLIFIFYRLSAGLNLYYLMFNVLTIAQEMIIKKKK